MLSYELIILGIYFLPTGVAIGRKGRDGIIMLNLLLGWTVIGWIIALVWALAAEKTGDNALGFGWVIVGLCTLMLVGTMFGTSDNRTVTQSTVSPRSSVANKTETKAKQKDEAKTKQEAEDKVKNVPTEYKSALNKATSYANVMHMSKQGVYDQLVSEYGEKFSATAAHYGIDNVKADWNANALAKARTYQDTMNMSPAAIRDQLVSEYGEKFTVAEADYAIQHLND